MAHLNVIKRRTKEERKESIGRKPNFPEDARRPFFEGQPSVHSLVALLPSSYLNLQHCHFDLCFQFMEVNDDVYPTNKLSTLVILWADDQTVLSMGGE